MHAIDESVAAMPSAKDTVMSYMQASPAGQTLLQQAGEHHPIHVDTEVSLENIRGNMGTQTPLANLVLSAFKDGGDKVLPEINAERTAQGLPSLGDSINAVLVPSGIVRAGIPAGQLDELSLQTIIMDSPTLLEMKGSALQKAIAFRTSDLPGSSAPSGFLAKTWNLMSLFAKDQPPMATQDMGKMVLAGQMRFTIDRSLPPLDRVSTLEIFDKGANKFVPIEPEKNYTVMTVSHLLRRMANAPAPGVRAASSVELSPDNWVFGRRLEANSIAGALMPSKLQASSSRDFLLDYLKANTSNGQFRMPPALLESPMRDISPDAWVPPLRPSLSSSVTIAGIAAIDKDHMPPDTVAFLPE
jgi:hypothetical protein